MVLSHARDAGGVFKQSVRHHDFANGAARLDIVMVDADDSRIDDQIIWLSEHAIESLPTEKVAGFGHDGSELIKPTTENFGMIDQTRRCPGTQFDDLQPGSLNGQAGANAFGQIGWNKQSLADVTAMLQANRTTGTGPVVESLIEALRSQDIDIRKGAITVLSAFEFVDRVAIDSLAKAAQDDADGAVRALAAAAVKKHGGATKRKE